MITYNSLAIADVMCVKGMMMMMIMIMMTTYNNITIEDLMCVNGTHVCVWMGHMVQIVFRVHGSRGSATHSSTNYL